MDLGASNTHSKYKELCIKGASMKFMLNMLQQMKCELQIEHLQLNSIIKRVGGDPLKSTKDLARTISSALVSETENFNEAETEILDEAEAVNKTNLDLGVGQSNDACQDSSDSERNEEFEMAVDEMDLPVDVSRPKRFKTTDSDSEMLDLNTYYGIDSQGKGPV